MPFTPEQKHRLDRTLESLGAARDELDAIAAIEPLAASPDLKVINDALDAISQAQAVIEVLGSDSDPGTPAGRPEWQLYLDRYDDVRRAGDYSEQWARRHFEKWGKNEGRVWGEVQSEARKRFHHYNASAWDDKGVAVVLCPGDRAESASIGGRRLRRHGNLDKGREVWADYSRRGLTGILELVIGDTSYQTEIGDAEGMTRGDCWGHR